MERFMPREGTFVATVFAPIQFPPASVLVFKRDPQGYEHLVATGSVLDLNPDRIILKRVIITGHPFKVNKRMATVKYMFFNKGALLCYCEITTDAPVCFQKMSSGSSRWRYSRREAGVDTSRRHWGHVDSSNAGSISR